MSRELPPAAFTLSVDEQGGIRVDMDGESYEIASGFSYPHMKKGQWNRLASQRGGRPDWRVEVRKSEDGQSYEVVGQCALYRVARSVRVVDGRISIQDTLTNLATGDLAIAFEHRIAPAFTPADVYVAGWNGPLPADFVAYDDATPINTTVYIKAPKQGLGVLLEDDYFRLQSSYGREGSTQIIRNTSFGLASGDSYTFEWSIIPTASNDYYEFINVARRVMDVNFTLPGTFAFLYEGTPLNTQTSEEQLRFYIDNLGLTMFASPDVWLGGVSGYMMRYETTGAGESSLFKPERYMPELAAWTEKVHRVAPEAKVLVKIQTTFSGPYRRPGEPIPFEDSTIVEADGSRKQQDGCYLHYPAIGNSYYQYLRGLVDSVLKDNKICDGIYFDTFAYNYWSKYGRWTYDRWDGRSVDIDPQTWTIKAKKADLCKLTEDARYELVNYVRELGGFVQINHCILTRKMRSLHISAFQEYRQPMDLVRLHLTSPVALGYYPGYQDRTRWEDESDLFDDVREHLRWGVLTQVYWVVPLNQSTIYKRMYPITPVRIGPGYVIGKERIVTLVSGTYTLGSAQEPMVWFYDAKGHECSSQKRTFVQNGRLYVQVTVPQDGAAVIAAPPSLRDALERELNWTGG